MYRLGGAASAAVGLLLSVGAALAYEAPGQPGDSSENTHDPKIIKVELGPIDVEGPQGQQGTFAAEISTGEIELNNESEVRGAQAFLSGELRALPPEERQNAKIAYVTESTSNEADESDAVRMQKLAASLEVRDTIALPKPPWFENKKTRRLVFTTIRVLLNGGGAFAIYYAKNGFPLSMSLMGAIAGAAISGSLQWYAEPFTKKFLDHAFLNKLLRLPSHHHPDLSASRVKQVFGKVVENAEFWAKWYGIEVGFITGVGTALCGMATWLGFDMGANPDTLPKIFSAALGTALLSTAGQGSWDKVIINRFRVWSKKLDPNKASLMLQSTFALNSVVSVLLSLSAMTGVNIGSVGLYGYAAAGLVALSVDWIKQPIQRWVQRVKTFLGFGKSGCENSMTPPDQNLSAIFFRPAVMIA